eukprot:8653128-Alexandrium_andersonii.AAC.1
MCESCMSESCMGRRSVEGGALLQAVSYGRWGPGRLGSWSCAAKRCRSAAVPSARGQRCSRRNTARS